MLIKPLENERDRLGTNTQQANIQAAQRNNSPSVSTVRECFSNDQVEQITQIVSQSISSFFASQQTTQTSRVDDPPTVSPPTPLERLEQLGQFPFLSSSELQQPSALANQPAVSNKQVDGGFTPEIPNKCVRDIESGEFF